jgi:DNA polymerase-3 subunit beta
VKIAGRASALDAALSLAALAVRGSKHGTVRIVTGNSSVSFNCTAPGIAIKVAADANIDVPGDVMVPAERLVGLISGFPSNGTITITTMPNAAMISCGNGKYRLPVMSDAPAALAMDYEIASIEMAGDDLLTLFEVVPAASAEEDRLYLNGVHLHSAGDQLIGVATDGVKLIRIGVAADHFSDDPSLIVPTKTAIAAVKLLKTTKPDKITLRRSGALIAVTGRSFELVASLLDYKYPSYECMLPQPSTNVALCARSELIDALARLKAVAGTIPLVGLSWTDGGPLRLSLPRQPGDADDAIPAEARGSVRIALSLPELTAMIENFSSDRLQLEGTDGDGPLVLCGEQTKLGLLTSCRWNFGDREKEAAA